MEHEPDDERPLLHSTRLPPAPTAELRPSDDQGTRAQELRDALEGLKADLEAGAGARPLPASDPAATNPTLTPPSGSSAGTTSAKAAPRSRAWHGRRVALGALTAVAVLAGVTGIVRVVAWSVAGAKEIPRPSESGSPTAAPSPSVSAPSVPAATTGRGTPSPGSAVRPAPPAFVLPPDLPRSGPGADSPGAELTAVLEGGGTVVVYERLVVRPGTTSVHLRPAPARELPRDLQGMGSTVTGLQVSVDGREVTPTADSLGRQVTRPDRAPITQLVLRYRLASAVVRASPAPPGRGTLVLRPITGPQAAGVNDPVVVRLRDPRIGQVYCPSAPQPLCDSVRGTAHVATVPAGAAPIVLAQVTLP